MIENNSLLRNTYFGKKVFVTGHTGFKGTWLINWLNLLGAEIKGYSLPPECDIDLYNQVRGDDLCSSFIGDIRDYKKLKKEVLDFQPDFIFHLAAQALVREGYLDPLNTYETNVIGTANLLNSVRFLKKHCVIVVVTTDKVYENREWHYPYRETDVLGGYDPYSSSKAMSEMVVSSYRNSFFPLSAIAEHQKTIATARAGNVIGGGDWAKDRIIPDIIRGLESHNKIKIRNPNSIRPWQHVLDSLYGYLTLGRLLKSNPQKFSEPWNFGPLSTDGISVQRLVEYAISIWGSGEYSVENSLNEPHESGILKLDVSKTIAELGWRPIWDSHEAIEKTVNWYKRKNENTKDLIVDDIENFEKLITRDYNEL